MSSIKTNVCRFVCEQANIALSAPILSRFDLFFVVLDDCNPDADRQVARHILKVHRCEDEAVRPPFTKDQMRRYIRFSRTLNPKITPESQRVMVDCYRKLRQGDTLGRSRSAYRITVRQLESMIRLSEALARLYCADEIQPSYVREAFRLLKTSIIQVETTDVEVDDDDDDAAAANDEAAPMDADDEEEDTEESQEETQGETQNLETQGQAFVHPGEYGSGEPAPETQTEGFGSSGLPADESEPAPPPPKKDAKKKKTKISYEEYETIKNAIAGHMRALESDKGDGGDEIAMNYLRWEEIVEWYLEQCEQEIGDSLERLDEMRKKVNLVIRHLINKDRILVTVGDAPKGKKEEMKTLLAVHPNYEVS
jgi:DNA replication licensing factor MCM6